MMNQMKNTIKVALVLLIVMGCLCGCVEQIPELSKEEEQAITEYAVAGLTRNNRHSDYRLVEDELPEEIEEADTQQKTQIETGDQIETVASPVEEVEETPETQEQTATETPIEVIVEQEEETMVLYPVSSITEILGMEGVSIDYSGSEVNHAYEPEGNAYFSLSASQGKTFVILTFTIENQTGEPIAVDMNQYDFSLSYGDQNQKKKKVTHTLTAEDVFSYQKVLEPGQTDRMVGIVEVVESEMESFVQPVLELRYQGETSLLTL